MTIKLLANNFNINNNSFKLEQFNIILLDGNNDYCNNNNSLTIINLFFQKNNSDKIDSKYSDEQIGTCAKLASTNASNCHYLVHDKTFIKMKM